MFGKIKNTIRNNPTTSRVAGLMAGGCYLAAAGAADPVMGGKMLAVITAGVIADSVQRRWVDQFDTLKELLVSSLVVAAIFVVAIVALSFQYSWMFAVHLTVFYILTVQWTTDKSNELKQKLVKRFG